MGEFTQEINGVVITFFSTASAVGKTLISTNMASELARQGKKVCLVDFDLQFGDVSNYLQLMPQRTVYDLQQAMTLQGNAATPRNAIVMANLPLRAFVQHDEYEKFSIIWSLIIVCIIT